MEKKFKAYLPDKWFYFPIIGLSLCLILKIINIGISFYRFPFNSITDLRKRVLYLSFLSKYGFHQTIDDMYHHIILFKDYPPGWYYFTLPFYTLTKDLIVAIFLSILAILVLGFLFIYFFNKNLTPIQRIAFFLFFFANLQMIDYFQIGRYSEMLGWVIFIPLFYYLSLYKKREIDSKFFLIIPLLFSALILTQMYIAVLGAVLILSLFLIRGYKEKLVIFLTMLIPFALTSFWWIPFLDFLKTQSIGGWIEELLNKGSFISYNTIFILGLFLISFFYIKQIKDKKNNKDIIFLIPSLILGFLVISRLIIFIPVFNRMPVTPYNVYFLFLLIYLFFQIDFKIKQVRSLIPWILIFLTLSSLLIFFFRISPFIPPKNELQAEIISFFPIIEENFFIFDVGNTEVSLNCFAKTNYNLSTPGGLYFGPMPEGIELKNAFKNQDCKKLSLLTQELHLKNLISYDQGCDVLKECGFDKKVYKKSACLYSTKIMG